MKEPLFWSDEPYSFHKTSVDDTEGELLLVVFLRYLKERS